MRAVFQRVRQASVQVAGQLVAGIGPGALILLGVARTDTEAEAQRLAGKVSQLRVFDDADGKMNRAIAETGGAFLVVSQFTLYGDCRKGNRPSYIAAAPPEQAEALYLCFVRCLAAAGHPVKTGLFRAMMQVELINDGPVTLLLDTEGHPHARTG